MGTCKTIKAFFYPLALAVLAGCSAEKKLPEPVTNPGPAKISTLNPLTITSKYADIGGKVENDGGLLISEKGICWKYRGQPSGGFSEKYLFGRNR